MRRQFILSEDDTEQLDNLGVQWETVREQSGQWLLLHGFNFPAGYNQANGSVAIQIPGNYPVAPIDMAYFYPHLARVDGQMIPQAQVQQPIDGKFWQRWSRHYPWVPGQHSIGTHILLVRHWLNHAVGKA
jgi:hypothetical protein